MEITAFARIAALALVGICCACAASAALLVQDGQPRATIVVGKDAPDDVRAAASDLQAILQRVSGATLPIADDASAVTGARILVGQAAAKEAAARLGITIPSGLTDAFDEEGYAVAVDGDTVILAGNETPPYEGSVYAVYDLLDQLGCRWYMPGAFGVVLPHLATVQVAPERRVVRPDFRVRNIWYSGWLSVTPEEAQAFALWKRRNRMSRSDMVGASFLPIPGDDTARYLLPKDKYWKTHPEYYALNADGTRNPDFLCMSNAGAFQAAVSTIEDRFRGNPDLHCFSFSPPDAPTLCHCPDCTKAMHDGFGGEGWGDVSDPYFDFVLRVADRIAKDCPGKWITSMAYYNRCRPPVDAIGKRKNLLMYLASIQQCAVHSYADDKCWTRRVFKDMLLRWSKLCAGLVYYEYDPHDWSMFQRPTWRSQGIADDFRLMKSVGGWGFNDEGQNAWLSTGLNYYIRARLAWNVHEDAHALLADFCNRFFGPASAPMLRCYEAIERAERDTGIDRPHDVDYTAVWPRPVLDRCLADLKDARAKAEAEPYRARVAAFSALIDRLAAFERAHEAMARGDYRAAAACGAEMAQAAERVGDPSLLTDFGPITKGNCSGAGITEIAEKIGAYAGGAKGRLVAVLCDDALFRTDPVPDGLVTGWFEPGLKTTGWRPIRLSLPWYDQGVVMAEGKRYSGVGWYRVRVTVPAADAASDLHLLLPTFRGSATVWCNGVFAAYVPPKHDIAQDIDLGRLMHAGENLLAFRLDGEGGMTLPPFLYQPATGVESASR